MNNNQFQNQSSPQNLEVKPATSKAAVICLACGILCFFGFGLIGLFLIGIVAGVIAVLQIKKSGGARGGFGLAIAGIILNCAAGALSIILLMGILGGAYYSRTKHASENNHISDEQIIPAKKN